MDHAKNMLLMTLWCSWILRVGASSLPAPPPPLDPPDAAGVRSPHDLCHVVLGAPARGEVGVVHGGDQGHGSGAAAVQVAQREGEVLDGVRGEAVLVLEHVVVDRAGGALDAGVRLEVEVELLRVADIGE